MQQLGLSILAGIAILPVGISASYLFVYLLLKFARKAKMLKNLKLKVNVSWLKIFSFVIELESSEPKDKLPAAPKEKKGSST